MPVTMRVLSLFNGSGILRYAIESAGFSVSKWYVSENDKYANIINDKHYPDTIHLGEVVELSQFVCMSASERNSLLRRHSIPEKTKQLIRNVNEIIRNGIDLFVGGSPCQGFSFAGNQLNFDDPRSRLFFEFVKIKNKLNPRYWVFENVRMDKKIVGAISRMLGVYPVWLNSNKIGAQNRIRMFCSNIRVKTDGIFGDLVTDIPQPKDRKIFLEDILQPESEVDEHYYIKGNQLEYMTKKM